MRMPFLPHTSRRPWLAGLLPGIGLAWALVLAPMLGLVLALAPAPARAADPVPVLIGHPGLVAVDAGAVARIYTGRMIDLAGQPVTAVNAPPGSALRQRFLALYLQQDEGQYHAYWTVRRHIGKGAPPRELATAAEVIAYVQATPGAVGYIDASEARPGLNIIARP